METQKSNYTRERLSNSTHDGNARETRLHRRDGEGNPLFYYLAPAGLLSDNDSILCTCVIGDKLLELYLVLMKVRFKRHLPHTQHHSMA